MKTIVILLLFIQLFFSISFAQTTKRDLVNDTNNNIVRPNSTEATGDTVSIKDNGGNVLLTVTDEGSAGSIKLNNSGSLSPGTNKLYNNGGSLYWNGSVIGGGVSGTGINDLSDGKYENSSLFLGEDAGTANANYWGNTGIGHQALYKSFSNSNTVIGRSAGYENTIGSQNVLIGPETNRYNQQGPNNTIIGYQAGFGNSTLHNKSGSVFIGFQAGYEELSSNKLYIENSSSSTPLIWGDFETKDVIINGDFHVTGNLTSANPIPASDNDWDTGLEPGAVVLYSVTNRVGIGTNGTTLAPKLHVKGDDGVLFQGNYSNGTALNLGTGTRFHFYPKKAAIRGGFVNGTQWDDANIGNYSTAFGFNITSSGYYSTAFGNGSVASNTTAFATGAFTVASGKWSTAMGSGSDALGSYSTALGNNSKAESHSVTAIGRYNNAGGDQTNWVSTDPIFEIGIGTNDTNRDNAVTVNKNGRTVIKAVSGVNPFTVQVGSSGKLLVFANGGTSIGTDATAPSNGLLVSGEIRNTGGLLHSSDERFKSNIELIPNALKSLKNIRGVYYMWKKDEFPEKGFTDIKQIGVIAQEVEKEFPELVRTGEDGYKSVDYTKLAPILIEAVKELHIENTELKNEIKYIRETIERLSNTSSVVKVSQK